MTVGSVLAIVATPVILALALAMAVSFRAWPFFVQDRIGAQGRMFRTVKLRTLPRRTAAYASKHELEPSTGTGFSQFLRRAHLDELPQLWLVPFGRMSLVGPRPKMPDWAEPIEPRYGYLRTLVKPGCTGLWQIGAHTHLEVAATPDYDLAYLERWSARLDLWILWRTALSMARIGAPVEIDDVPVVLHGRGLLERSLSANSVADPVLEAA